LWAVAGLGNPGRKYSGTRHNAGFLVINGIAEKYGIELKEKEAYIYGKGSIGDAEVVLVEPLTFMNRSGLAVKKILDKFRIHPENLIVIHDDIDIETGRLKIKKDGSSGGHKGVSSIIEAIGAKQFIRIKIGIGRDDSMTAEDYVLKKFPKSDMPLIKEAVSRAVDAVPEILSRGVDSAMNKFNKLSL
jgi:PTH1 family peptidyl-tRNA hydrolase